MGELPKGISCTWCHTNIKLFCPLGCSIAPKQDVGIVQVSSFFKFIAPKTPWNVYCVNHTDKMPLKDTTNTHMAMAFQVSDYEWDIFANNTVVSASGVIYACTAPFGPNTSASTGNNTFITPNNTALPFSSGCVKGLQTFRDWQSLGYDKGSVQESTALTSQDLVDMARRWLDLFSVWEFPHECTSIWCTPKAPGTIGISWVHRVKCWRRLGRSESLRTDQWFNRTFFRFRGNSRGTYHRTQFCVDTIIVARIDTIFIKCGHTHVSWNHMYCSGVIVCSVFIFIKYVHIGAVFLIKMCTKKTILIALCLVSQLCGMCWHMTEAKMNNRSPMFHFDASIPG